MCELHTTSFNALFEAGDTVYQRIQFEEIISIVLDSLLKKKE